MPDTVPRRDRLRARLRRLHRDTRAIEGLPVRLVVSLVVGAACLSVMLQLLGGMTTVAVAELDVRPTPEVTAPGEQQLTLTVVDPDGDPVAGATVVVRSGSASLDGPATAETDAAGNATVTIDPSLASNQGQGTVVFEIKPPAGSEYADRRENSYVLVVRE